MAARAHWDRLPRRVPTFLREHTCRRLGLGTINALIWLPELRELRSEAGVRCGEVVDFSSEVRMGASWARPQRRFIAVVRTGRDDVLQILRRGLPEGDVEVTWDRRKSPSRLVSGV